MPRLVLNVFIFVTNFIIEGNLFQACYATEKKVLARCLSLMAGKSYSSPFLLVCGLLAGSKQGHCLILQLLQKVVIKK